MRTKYWIVSLGLHLLILLFLFLIHCPDTFSRLDKEFYVNLSSSAVLNQYPETGEAGGKLVPISSDQLQAPDRADLATEVQSEKIITRTYHDDLPLPVYSPKATLSAFQPGRSVSDHPGLRSPASDLPLPGNKTKLGLPGKGKSWDGRGDFFSLEGDLKNRMVITQSVPEPVSGLKEEVTVTFRLVVDGKGHVIEITPIQKGDFRVEASSLKALKEWKFNPLPAAEKDSLQSGVIVLIFKLQ